MKKRLLITSALMTAVLGASLATGTYAWYQAEAGNVALNAATGGSITTGIDGASISAINLNAAFSDVDKVALTDEDDGLPYMLDSGGKKIAYNGGLPTYDVVTLTISGDALTDWSSIAGTYTVTVTATGSAKVAAGAKTDALAATGYGATATATVVINQNGIGTSAPVAESDSVELQFTFVVRGLETKETTVTAGLTASIAAA